METKRQRDGLIEVMCRGRMFIRGDGLPHLTSPPLILFQPDLSGHLTRTLFSTREGWKEQGWQDSFQASRRRHDQLSNHDL